jgi:hypothetical protein
MPADPAAFVVAAARMTNDRDAAAAAALFAQDADSVMITDGALEHCRFALAYPRTGILLREQRRAGARPL